MPTKKQSKPKTFKDVLKITGEKKPDFSALPEADRKHYEADWTWKQIVKALNKLRDPNWVCDFLNENQYKYYPYAWLVANKKKPTGFAFSDADYICTNADTDVGSRLRFASNIDVVYALKHFEQEYIASVIY